MAEVISVQFKGGSKNYFFDPRGLQIEPGTYVVVETSQGLEYVSCVEGNHEVPDWSVVQPLRPVARIATENDHRAAEYIRKREKEAFGICERKIAAHGLEMKLVNVECSFEGNKIIFFFTADGRVDFRELVKDLASVFRARIELRQIGVRDEAKMLGGLGICGRPLCCHQFLDEFMPVSIKMAKTQNLSLNPAKISGTCGRLMCCLKYEQAAYEDAAGRMPKNESYVDTPDGIGNVSGVDLLREQVQVRLDSAPESPRRYKVSEIRVLRNGKGSREGIAVPEERPARREEAGGESRFVRRGCVNRDIISAPPLASDGAGEKDQQNRRRQKQGKPRQQVRPARPVQQGKGERPEKIPVRPAAGTTAEKKAAADRAARQQSEPVQKPANNRRRPYYRRPRGKGQG